MASLSIGSGTYIGNPVIVTVTPGTTPTGAVFHRVILQVTVNSTHDFTFSSMAGGGAIAFDVSSALKAVADSATYTPDIPQTATTYSFTAAAWDEWMVNGAIGDNHLNPATATSGSYKVGALSDLMRYTSRPQSGNSLKPASSRSPEVAFVDYNSITGGVATAVAAGLSGNVYGITRPADGYELRFINSLGVHENVFVNCLPSSEVNYQTERHIISRQETLANFSRGIALKRNNHERWKMSSGPLDRKWQQYYLHEVLMARWAWLDIGSASNSQSFLPVHILPDDTVPAIDRAAATPLTVDFTIEFDMNGSPTT